MAGFEPASDTSKPKEGSRSMSSTTGEGRKTKKISLPLFEKPTKPFNLIEWSIQDRSQRWTIYNKSTNRTGHNVKMRKWYKKFNRQKPYYQPQGGFGGSINGPLTLSTIKKVGLEYGKMFCFAPASVESFPDRWKFVNQLNIDVHVLAYTVSDSSIQKSFGLGGIRTHVRHLQT